MQEVLEIKKAKYNKNIKVLNRNEDNQVKTNTCTPLLKKKTLWALFMDGVQLPQG